MPFESPYQQMIHVLSARGLSWFGAQIEKLPPDLLSDHPCLPILGEAGEYAPILSALRGTPSPLETFIKRRLSTEILAELVARIETGEGDAASARLLLTGQLLGLRVPGLSAALRRLAAEGLADRPVRMALSGPLTGPELAGIEERLRQVQTPELMSEESVAGYAEDVMLSYAYGACRPRFSTARAYGEIFDNCLRLAEWARSNHSLGGMAQMVYCLCLIDPDTDVGDLVGEIISSQRPDGSFPARSGYGTADQCLTTANRTTMQAVAALHMVIHRRWRQPPHYPLAA